MSLNEQKSTDLIPKHKWTDLHMFICTYTINLSGMKEKFDKDLMDKLIPEGKVVAINSNFGHKCLPGFEHCIKTVEAKEAKKAKRKKKAGEVIKKERKYQGDGTCFSHAMEPIIQLGDRLYKARCFTASGDTQIPGIVCQDFSDGRQVANIFVDYINRTRIFKEKVAIIKEIFTLRDYNFEMKDVPSNLLIKSKNVAKFFTNLITNPDKESELKVTQVNYSNDDNKLSITFEKLNIDPNMKNGMLLKVFPRGKMNILGVKQQEEVRNFINMFKKSLMKTGIILHDETNSYKNKA